MHALYSTGIFHQYKRYTFEALTPPPPIPKLTGRKKILGAAAAGDAGERARAEAKRVQSCSQADAGRVRESRGGSPLLSFLILISSTSVAKSSPLNRSSLTPAVFSVRGFWNSGS